MHLITDSLRVTKAIMFPTIYKKLRKWQDESNSINILVTGTGKSALINSIIGKDIAEEGDTLKPQTTEIEHTIENVGNVKVQVWDSPGLQDGTKAEGKYIKLIKESCSEYDLIVYVIRMSQARILKDGPDCRAMQILSTPEVFGPNMWHNTIIVLTFANISEAMAHFQIDASKPSPIEAKVQEQLKATYDSAVSAIQSILIESVCLSKKLANSIPIAPAGYKKDSPTLPKCDCKIMDGKRFYWLSNLWLAALRVTKLDAQPAMIKLNEHRLAESREEYEGRYYSTKADIADQMPLIFGAKGAEIGKKLYHRLFGAGTTLGTAAGIGLGHLCYTS